MTVKLEKSTVHKVFFFVAKMYHLEWLTPRKKEGMINTS